MADPLGLIGRANMGGTANVAGLSGLGARPPGVGGEKGTASFKQVLLENIEQVNQLQAEATAATEDLASGKRTDIENVLLATQKADEAFRMLVALRNKVHAAYEELKQVRV